MTATTLDRYIYDESDSTIGANPVSGNIIAIVNSYFTRYTLISETDDQAWFWTPEWQASIYRSMQQLQAGEGTVYGSGASFLASLGDA